jgi:RNA polymerase sigma factor (sigma-70 family)
MTDPGQTDRLPVELVAGGASVRAVLLDPCRDRLRRTVWIRMDQRLRAGLDLSDVVQEALVTAHRRRDESARQRPMDANASLRPRATDRLIDLHRRYLQADRRDVTRDIREVSTWQLAAILAKLGMMPLRHLLRDKLCHRVGDAMATLTARARGILLLRLVKQLSIRESAQVRGATESALKSRPLRALQSLARFFKQDLE